MTDQIVIKLNEKKFRHLLDGFNKEMKGCSQSDSWLVGFTLWYMNRFLSEKIPYLNNKTIVQYLMEKRKWTFNESMVMMMGKFTEYLKQRD
jgi:hypothetical protein